MRIDLSPSAPPSDVHIDLPAATQMVVISAVDGIIRDRSGSCEEARVALDLLAASEIPTVLMSQGGPGDVQDVQRELGLRHPFICEGGASLYIPRGYFAELDGLTSGDEEWEVFTFGAPDPARAIRLLTSLFSVRGEDILTIGFASDWQDRALLASVDVPVVVRNGSAEQHKLVRRVPGAYLTDASGPAGWCEAVLGSTGV